MLSSLIKKIVGSKNQRQINKILPVVGSINKLESKYQDFSLAQIKESKDLFQGRFQRGETLDDLLLEAFALVREASKRCINMRHFDVQLIGGICLHRGTVVEMRTGEGKTLVATLAAYLNSLSGKPVHVVTVNDYLAKRDAQWMMPLYEALDVSVGVLVSDQSHEQKLAAYQADITYGTNNEFGFDYLRDNMVISPEQKVQRELSFAIIDEVDSILIDEARTPLIISGAADNHTKMYQCINKIIPAILKEDVKKQCIVIEEAHHSIELTDYGHEFVENLLIKEKLLPREENLYDSNNVGLLHYINSALRAHKLYKKNDHYLVKNDAVVIIDEHTGRSLLGRRWAEGLHQAVEAKENVTIQKESQTLASTSFQNYFLLYDKIAGMTGTADTEAEELKQIYNLEVVVIPTNKPSKRIDLNDLIYPSISDKYQAIVDTVSTETQKERPVLIGTASVEQSESMSAVFKKHGIKHNMLNAKNHQEEAKIIAEAGRPGKVTIATNMAGRGTDIVLGGNLEIKLKECGTDKNAIDETIKSWDLLNKKVIAAGGLYVVGSERHESRRIDNQLRGRTARQGDPGSTRFFLSLEDDLMRIFVSDQVQKIMQFVGMEKGMAIEHPMVNRAIAKAQRKIELRNFQSRKELLEYDNIANEQRRLIYGRRNKIIHSSDISEQIQQAIQESLTSIFYRYVPVDSYPDQWDITSLEGAINQQYSLQIKIKPWLDDAERLDEKKLQAKLHLDISEAYIGNNKELPQKILHGIEKQVMLQVIDNLWKEHLLNMDHLRQGIHLRSYGQRSPKQEYKKESFQLFSYMWQAVGEETTKMLFHLQIDPSAYELAEREENAKDFTNLQNKDFAIDNASATRAKLGRNDKCFCGSEKKYKHCHG